MVIGIGMALAVYALFFPFIESVGTIKFYNSSYYGALASVERASLVLRYHEPWFEWSGWWQWLTNFWPVSDARPTDFWLLGNQTNSMQRSIRSQTTSIPTQWEGNIEVSLQTGDSVDYNSLSYFSLEEFFLSVDATSSPDNYYTTTGKIIRWFTGESIHATFRLPFVVQEIFWWIGKNLCTDESIAACDSDGDTAFDDVVVDWIVEGDYDLWLWWWTETFRINPTLNVLYSVNPAQVQVGDNALRESIVNQYDYYLSITWPNLIFSAPLDQNIFNPIDKDSWFPTWHNIIAADETTLESVPFYDIVTNSNPLYQFSGLVLKNQLLSRLETEDSQIYPYLEYAIDFDDVSVADRFYTIQWVGKVGDFQVTITVKKPTSNLDWVGDFTIIF